MERIIHGDVLSPILAYMRLNGNHKVILESIPREKENARFSILAYNPVFEIKFENGVLYQNGQVIDRDPLDFLYEVTHESQHHSDLPFGGGAIGFVGYDMISLYEEIGQLPEDTIGTPDMHFFVYESYMVFDHKKEKIHIIEDALYSNRSHDELEATLDQVLEELKIPASGEFEDLDLSPLQFRPHIAPQKFEEIVETARDLIRKGDMFQCVLSQRFSAEVTGNPFDFYRNLRVTNPSNYLYFYDFGDYQIIGASPESLVSVKNGIVTTNPIAGTRPRGANDEEDAALASNLLSDEKETAEHRMLVDLGRNDIGRIAETASVQVTKYMEVELFRYVMHLTSVVKGRLLPELTAMDALKATLPLQRGQHHLSDDCRTNDRGILRKMRQGRDCCHGRMCRSGVHRERQCREASRMACRLWRGKGGNYHPRLAGWRHAHAESHLHHRRKDQTQAAAYRSHPALGNGNSGQGN